MNETLEFALEDYKGILVYEEQVKARRDAAGKQKVIKAMAGLQSQVSKEGAGFELLFWACAEAIQLGNPYPEAAHWLDAEQQALFVSACRQYGVDQFVYASAYSHAIEDAWIFLQNGCVLEGMVEINDSYKAPWEDVFQVKHGLLFRVLPENNKQ